MKTFKSDQIFKWRGRGEIFKWKETSFFYTKSNGRAPD